ISSTVSTTVSAHSPCRTAFRRDRRLPSSVLGPVLLMALRRLASICRNEVMGWSVRRHFSAKHFLHHWQDQWRPRSSYGHLLDSPEAGSPKALLPFRVGQ